MSNTLQQYYIEGNSLRSLISQAKKIVGSPHVQLRGSGKINTLHYGPTAYYLLGYEPEIIFEFSYLSERKSLPKALPEGFGNFKVNYRTLDYEKDLASIELYTYKTEFFRFGNFFSQAELYMKEKLLFNPLNETWSVFEARGREYGILVPQPKALPLAIAQYTSESK